MGVCVGRIGGSVCRGDCVGMGVGRWLWGWVGGCGGEVTIVDPNPLQSLLDRMTVEVEKNMRLSSELQEGHSGKEVRLMAPMQ